MNLPAAVFFAALAAVPVFAQPTASSADAPLLTLTATAEVARTPDIADVSAGVVTEAATAGAAMQDNAAAMTKVVAALRRAGVAERDIQTAGISLSPRYRYDQNQPPVLVGYQASNSVSVRLRKLADSGRIIDTLVTAGANQVSGPSFRLDQPEAALDEARAAAVRKARGRADIYAAAAGLRVLRIVSISEPGGFVPPPMPAPRMMKASADMAESTPVVPGEVELAATVTVVFALQ